MCSAYFFSKAENNFLKTDIFLASENLVNVLIQENTYYSCFSVFFYPVSLAFQCSYINPYLTAFPYGNGMVLHFYQQQESSMTKTVHKVINKGLKAYV